MSRVLDRVLGADRPEAIRPRSRSVYEPGLEIAAAGPGKSPTSGRSPDPTPTAPVVERQPKSTNRADLDEVKPGAETSRGGTDPPPTTSGHQRRSPTATGAISIANVPTRVLDRAPVAAVEVSRPPLTPDLASASFPIRPVAPTISRPERTGTAGRGRTTAPAGGTPAPAVGEGGPSVVPVADTGGSDGPSQSSAVEPIRPVPRSAAEPISKAPIVRVTIGRVDIRAAVPPAVESGRRSEPRPGPELTLADYLTARAAGPRR